MTQRMRKHLRWLPGARRIRMYLSVGNALPLKRHLQFMGGLRGRIEDLVVSVLCKAGFGFNVGNNDVLQAYQELRGAVEVDALMLLYTGWYKNTVFVGPVQAKDGRLYFAKSFKMLSDAHEEFAKAQSVRALADGYFKTAEVLTVCNHTILYELVEHSRAMPDDQAVEDACLAMCAASLRGATSTQRMNELIDFDVLLDFCTKLPEQTEGLMHALEYIRKIDISLNVCSAHGDFTPWNIFSAQDGSICLIDYERFFCATPYFDYFHFYCQPGAMINNIGPANEALRKLINKSPNDEKLIKIYFLAYLIIQIYADLDDWCRKGLRHRQLGMLIKSKSMLIVTHCKW